MIATPRVHIVILNYERPALTLRLLESVVQMDYHNATVVVVDNASNDDSLDCIRSAFPSVTVIDSEHNLGFAGGMNLGLQVALSQGADYVLLLNNDTTVAPDLLQQLVACAEREHAAAAAPVICYEKPSDRIWSAGAHEQPLTRDIRGNRIGQRYHAAPPYWVDYATACAILIRCSVLRQVGLFDERFFMYYEDLDWCWRLKALGHKIIIVPQARVWHRVAATIGGSDSQSERYYMALSSVLFFRKHTRGWRWLIVIPFRTLSALKTSLRLAQRPSTWPALGAYWRGLWHGLRA